MPLRGAGLLGEVAVGVVGVVVGDDRLAGRAVAGDGGGVVGPVVGGVDAVGSRASATAGTFSELAGGTDVEHVVVGVVVGHGQQVTIVFGCPGVLGVPSARTVAVVRGISDSVLRDRPS